jgi:hypothetical protein
MHSFLRFPASKITHSILRKPLINRVLLEQFRRAGAKPDAMHTIVLIRLGADRRAPMTVKDLTTGHTEVVPADPGVLAQLEHDVSEGYFEAILNGGGFSFGNRVPPPDDD